MAALSLLRTIGGWGPGRYLAILAAGLGVWILSLAVYRLCFHPLRKYPGPRLAALSNWYTFFPVSRGEIHTQIRIWHEKYGSVIRIGPNSICFNTDTGYSAIYNSRTNPLKDESYAAFSVSRKTPNLISSTDNDLTRFKKKAYMSILSEKNVEKLQDRLIEKISTFMDVVEEKSNASNKDESSFGWGMPVNMAQEACCLTLEIITDLCFGQTLPFMRDPDCRWVLTAIKTMSWRGIMHAYSAKYFEWRLEHISLYIFMPYYKLMLRLGAWALETAKVRMSMGSDPERQDFFSDATQAQDTKTGNTFSIKDLWVESVLLLVAGSDTAATTMSAVLFHVLHQPLVLEEVQKEIRDTFKDLDDIRLGPQLRSCQYLKACISEAMRLSPAVSIFKPRLVQAGGIEIDGHFIPQGSYVGSALYALHRNQDYFQDPDTYRPDRWSADQRNAAFNPFSAGPRMCVGVKLAWAEMSITLARLLFAYDIRLADDSSCCKAKASGQNCDYAMKAYATAFVEGPMMHVRKRKNMESHQ